MINVLLVDDLRLVRSGIRRLLEDIKDISVIGDVGTGEEAIAFSEKYPPDVILMDLQMPGIGGLEATNRLSRKFPSIKIIVLASHNDEPFPSRLLRGGASGYLSKSSDIEEIVAAIRSVHDGQRYISADIARNLALTFQPGVLKSPVERLSSRELQIMLMVARGSKAQQISDVLCLSAKTVNTYRYRIFDKLEITSDFELSRIAQRHGLLGD